MIMIISGGSSESVSDMGQDGRDRRNELLIIRKLSSSLNSVSNYDKIRRIQVQGGYVYIQF